MAGPMLQFKVIPENTSSVVAYSSSHQVAIGIELHAAGSKLRHPEIVGRCRFAVYVLNRPLKACWAVVEVRVVLSLMV
jgi:hypothetical protein